MSKYAPRRDDGLFAYVITKKSWGKEWKRIEWAESLTAAKRRFGWTRQAHTTVIVHRATADDFANTDEIA